jgi:hypothetical protein
VGIWGGDGFRNWEFGIRLAVDRLKRLKDGKQKLFGNCEIENILEIKGSV